MPITPSLFDHLDALCRAESWWAQDGSGPGEAEVAALLAEREVTSLALLGVTAAPLDLAEPLGEALRRRLEAAAESPEQEGRSFLEAAELLGREVEVQTGPGAAAGCQGTLLGLEVEGPAPGTAQLLVQTPAGVQRAVAAHVQGVNALRG